METVADRSVDLQAEIQKALEQQKPASLQFGDGTIINALVKLLEAQELPLYRAAVAGDVNHFQTEQDDSGWGCGWRNLQMVCSHLIRHDEEMQKSLFSGCGFVPDILSLQTWLEVAWKAGFDTVGGDMLGNAMRGSHQWIGTTECAALLRFFGLKAHIIDFTGGLKNPNIQQNAEGKEMHMGVACDNCGKCPITGQRFNSQAMNNCDLCEKCHALPGAERIAPFRLVHNQVASRSKVGVLVEQLEASHEKAGKTVNREEADLNQQNIQPHRRLMQWVWNYFVDQDLGLSLSADGADQNGAVAWAFASQPSKQASVEPFWTEQVNRAAKHCKIGGRRHSRETSALSSHGRSGVIRSGKPPLYFQHEGHSRTIIGVERYLAAGPNCKGKGKQAHNPDGFVYNLLLLDPAFKTTDLANALRTDKAWQRLLKQGTYNLRSQQYQLLYVDDGVLHRQQLEDWKVLKAAETY